MIGSPGKATKAVDINRIPVLYDRIIASLKRFDLVNFDFIKQVCYMIIIDVISHAKKRARTFECFIYLIIKVSTVK